MDLSRSGKLGSKARTLMIKYHIPGLTVAVVQGDKITTAAYGQESLDPIRRCKDDTLFGAASSSKSLTAAAIAILIDSHKHPNLQYETPMSTLLPEDFVMQDPDYTRLVTVEDVLSHRTGIATHNDSFVSYRSKYGNDPKTVTRNIRNLEIAAPIRAKWIYSNVMYVAASYLLEQLSELSFPKYLMEHIFKPLSMTSTSLHPSGVKEKGQLSRLATGYEWHAATSTYIPVIITDKPESQGSGCIISTATDFAKWIQALMNRDGPITEAVYSGMVKQRMFKNPDTKDLYPLSSADVYAAGLNSWFYRGYRIIGHSGSEPGYGSFHFFMPDFKFGAAMFGNSSAVGSVGVVLAMELVDEMLGVEGTDWERVVIGSPADETREEALQRIYPGVDVETQKSPLEMYVGTYWNNGYYGMTVEVRDGGLFINAGDRSYPFTLEFEHVCDEVKYIVKGTFTEDLGSLNYGWKAAEFKIKDELVIAVGLDLAPELGKLIWFDKKS